MPGHDATRGALGATELLRSDGARHRLPERLRQQLEDAHGGGIALYVLDVEGSCLRLLAGGGHRVPEVIPGALGVGPEVPPEALEALAAAAQEAMPGCGVAPLILADRALGAIVRRDGPSPGLDAAAREAALALETIGGYTDVVHAARRRRHPRPAAEMQQNLLPPRIARVTGAQVAGGVLPGYDVAGDFIDHAENEDGVWLAIADAVGKENEAAALAAVTVGALRASRRSASGLEAAVGAMAGALRSSGLRRHAFVTAVVAVWEPGSQRLRWITAGHPRPVVLRADGTLETLTAGVVRPLGIEGDLTRMRAAEDRLSSGERLLLYSDGLVEQPDRRTAEPVGIEAVHEIVRGSADQSAAQLVRRLQDLVIAASGDRLRDDVSLLALAVDGDRAAPSRS